MKKMMIAMALIGALCLPAMAETNYNVCFNSLDADYDGGVSKSEFMVVFPNGDIAVFEEADADKDGSVSHEEWEAWKESRGIEESH